jgi:hypothetical protein
MSRRSGRCGYIEVRGKYFVADFVRPTIAPGDQAQFDGSGSTDGNIYDATFGKVVKTAPPRISQVALFSSFSRLPRDGTIVSTRVAIPRARPLQAFECSQGASGHEIDKKRPREILPIPKLLSNGQSSGGRSFLIHFF